MPQVYGEVFRDVPSDSADGTQKQVRASSYGEQYVVPLTKGTYALADEGSYFKATNPTVGTGIIHALTAAFSATAALFCLRNTDAGSLRIYLDYVKLLPSVVPMTAATSIEAAVTLDSTNRWASGGTSITPINPNMDSAQGSIANINFGAVVLAAASGSVRIAGRAGFPRRAAPAMVLGDQLMFQFGDAGEQSVTPIGSATPATAPASMNAQLGPAIIGPGDSLNFHVWYPAAATTAVTYEFEIGWWER